MGFTFSLSASGHLDSLVTSPYLSHFSSSLVFFAKLDLPSFDLGRGAQGRGLCNLPKILNVNMELKGNISEFKARKWRLMNQHNTH